ncbi:MAG TPA: hypothetical protein VF014_13005, partial [Casimicrobiaceae bacterium]|nr:hypothetical protein [Casimicrobiaceae bacterium]
LERGIGVEVGVWNVRAAQALLGGGLANERLRILIEPAEGMADARANRNKSRQASVESVSPGFCIGSAHRPGRSSRSRQDATTQTVPGSKIL